jgi:hypothetical protein
MADADGAGYVAECYWPGIQGEDLFDLDRRIEVAVAGLAGQAKLIRYLGSMLVIDDEVVLCLFEGSIEAVRQVLDRSGVPFERILCAVQTIHSHNTLKHTTSKEP